MTTRTVVKALAGEEDLLLGFGSANQTRNGQAVAVNKINAESIPYTSTESIKDRLDSLPVIVYVSDFGTIDGTGDQAAIEAAIAYADSVCDNTSSGTASVTIVCFEDLSITSQILLPAKNRLNVDFRCSVTVTGWDLSASTPAILCRNRQSFVHIDKLDCGTFCAGVETFGYDFRYSGGQIQHFRSFGYKHSNGGNQLCKDVTIQQWVQNDDAFNTAVGAYGVPNTWNAVGVYEDGADSKYENINAAWCKIPLYLSENASLNLYQGCHFYNGNPESEDQSTPETLPQDPVIVENHSSSANYLTNCYFDNGHIDLYSSALVIRGGHYLILSSRVAMSENDIRYYTENENDEVLNVRINNIRASVGFYTSGYAGGSGSWDGDYTTINATDEGASIGDQLEVLKRRRVVIPNTDTSVSSLAYYKPGGSIINSYNIGTTEVGYFKADSSGYGLYSNNLDFGNGAGNIRWSIGVAGNFYPAVDASVDVGSSLLNTRALKGKRLWLMDLSQAPSWLTSTSYSSEDSTFALKYVTHGGAFYTCIVSHVSSSATEPGVGDDWEDYWVAINSPGTNPGHTILYIDNDSGALATKNSSAEVKYIGTSDGSTGGTGTAGSGNQYVELEINGTTYKLLHDGTV